MITKIILLWFVFYFWKAIKLYPAFFIESCEKHKKAYRNLPVEDYLGELRLNAITKSFFWAFYLFGRKYLHPNFSAIEKRYLDGEKK